MTDKADEVLGFGKHREKTHGEAAEIAEYVEWAFSIPKPKGKLLDFVDYCKAAGKAPAAAPEAPPPSAPAAKASSAAAAAAASSDDEEERPLTARKVATKRVQAEPKEGDEAAKADDAATSEDETPLSKRPKTAKEGDEPAAPGGSSESNKTVAAKIEQDESSEDEAPLAARQRPAATKTQGKGKAKQAEAEADDDDDDDDDDDAPADKHTIAMAVRFANAVMARGARGDPEGVLSVLGVHITRETPYEEMRRAYRGLAKLLHPDKLGRHFAGATKAFQTLTTAFDTLTAPEPASQPGGGKKGKKAAAPTVGRSNDNCFRTTVRCPRCEAPWGKPDSGLQPYEYSFMMQGLRTYVCCGCLLEFGCMSAIHECPHCNSEIGYHPKKYHNQMKCMKCKNSFGFKLFTTGPVIEARLREHLLEKAAKRQVRYDSDASRQQRAPLEVPPEQKAAHDEHLFRFGMLQACPRCGREDVSKGLEGKELELSRRRHLRDCTDVAAHRAYAKKVAERVTEKARAQSAKGRQDEVERLAAWRFLGGDASSAWMLTDRQLEDVCVEKGLDGSGGREQALARLAFKQADDAHEANPGGGSSSTITMPENLHTLSLEALRSLAAAHGITLPAGCKKDSIIKRLEKQNGTLNAIEYGAKGGTLLLKNGDEVEVGEEGSDDGEEVEKGEEADAEYNGADADDMEEDGEEDDE